MTFKTELKACQIDGSLPYFSSRTRFIMKREENILISVAARHAEQFPFDL